MRHVALQARGSALPLAKGLLEQIPQFLRAGIPAEVALRESLQIAIHSARVRARHCVGSERYALDDFITTCLQMEALTDQVIRV
jgi:hypothetical protein